MAKVFTTVPGARVEVGSYGYATANTPAEVPDRVGRELVDRSDLRVEFLPPATATEDATHDEIRTAYPRRRR